MGFLIPNEPSAAFLDQAEPDSLDFQVLTAAPALTGVISGCAVTAQGSPNMTVAVTSGIVSVDGVQTPVTSGNVTITTASGSNPRFDLICVDSAGVKSAVVGTASTNPVFPDPAGKAVLAAVYVPAADTSINSNQIIDKRVTLRPWRVRDLTELPHKDIRNFGASPAASAAANTAAIQAAVDALASTGGNVYIPTGVYNINDTIEIINDGIFLIGDYIVPSIFSGSLYKGSILKWNGALGGTMVDFMGSTPPNYLRTGGARNLHLDGNGNGSPTTAPASGFRLRAAFHLNFWNCHVTECSEACWDFNDFNESVGWGPQNNCWGIRLHDCSGFTYSVNGGVFVCRTSTTTSTYSGATHVYFYGCFAQVKDGVGLDWNTCDDIYYYGGSVAVSGTGSAVEFRGHDVSGGKNYQKACTDSMISGMYTSGNIYARAGSGSQPSRRNIAIAINYGHDVGIEEAITVEDGAELTVIHNDGTTRGLQQEYRTCSPPLVDDFIGGIASFGKIGDLAWNVASDSYVSMQAAEDEHPGIIRLTTTAASGTVAHMTLGSNGTGQIWADMFYDLVLIVRLNTNDSDTQVRVGLASSGSGDPAGSGVYFEKLYADTSWFGVTRYGSVQTRSAALTASSTGWITFHVRKLNASQMMFYVNLGDVVFQSNNVPVATPLQPFFQIKNQTASAKTLDIDLFRLNLFGGISR